MPDPEAEALRAELEAVRAERDRALVERDVARGAAAGLRASLALTAERARQIVQLARDLAGPGA